MVKHKAVELDPLRKALREREVERVLISKTLKEEDRWDREAARILELKKQCKSLRDPKEFSRFLAEKLRYAYKQGENNVRFAIKDALKIEES